MWLPPTLDGILAIASASPGDAIDNPLMVDVAEAGSGYTRFFEIIIFIYVEVEDGIQVHKFLISGVWERGINFSIF